MAESLPITGDLVKAKAITVADIDLLVDTYLAAPSDAVLPLGPVHRISVEAAIQAHPRAATPLANPATGDGLRRTMIRTAIIMARPEEA